MTMHAEELKAIRTGLSMTQQAFADAVGLSRKAINEMERSRAPIERRTELGARFLSTCGHSNTMFAMALKCRRAAAGEDSIDAHEFEQIAEWLESHAALPRDWAWDDSASS
jgi:transcriptional regulator with XRE-family HTH domain